ncbi:MAG: hypothetical protein JNM94_05740 [Phycisphaerae bacterium]|nr:hypothetical protein [Phycisphaerae bacterium]
MCSDDSARGSTEAAREAPRTSLRALLARYMACPAESKPASFLAFVRSEDPHVFSHHASGRSDYRDHVWRVGGLYLCRGCTTVIVTTPVFLGIALLSRWPVRMPTAATAATFSALLLVSLLPLRDGPRTALHDLRRVSLGCLLGSALAYVVLTESWALRGVVLGAYVAVLVARRAVRRRHPG